MIWYYCGRYCRSLPRDDDDMPATIASGLLAAYLGGDAGSVHARWSAARFETIRAVVWYADIRGFTAIADTTPGLIVIELINAIFETLTASLRARWSSAEISRRRHARDVSVRRCDAGYDLQPSPRCRSRRDGRSRSAQCRPPGGRQTNCGGRSRAPSREVLYGNVGAVDRLDFTVIGPAVNEAARIETLCEPLGRKVLISAELAAVVGDRRRLEPLGYHTLRGVREPREIYGLVLGFKA